MNDRDHRKLLVIDGREAFVGGHCIVDTWLGNAEDINHYADLSVRLHGPIVHSVQAAFSKNFGGQTGELFLGDDVFPALEPVGDVMIHAAYAKPEGSAPAVKILHHTVICLARKRLWIQNPYFIPKPQAIDAMGAAVKRGVDVRVLMPATSGSDNPMVQHAGHRNFEKLLRCGVRLFDRGSICRAGTSIDANPRALPQTRKMRQQGKHGGSCGTFSRNHELIRFPRLPARFAWSYHRHLIRSFRSKTCSKG